MIEKILNNFQVSVLGCFHKGCSPVSIAGVCFRSIRKMLLHCLEFSILGSFQKGVFFHKTLLHSIVQMGMYFIVIDYRLIVNSLYLKPWNKKGMPAKASPKESIFTFIALTQEHRHPDGRQHQPVLIVQTDD